ncbi:MAG: leucine-rich repeat domain-containing protein [Alphaproteobacteria bacterium]|nr:leucine-rich repeat domain-containing protein [Alphaproteobacteria bacterium]
MKKTFLIILAASTIFTGNIRAETTIVASGNNCGTNCSWSVDSNGVLSISVTEGSSSGSIGNYSNTSNLSPWYNYRNSISSISLEGPKTDSDGNKIANSGITSVGSWAFYNVKAQSINIPDSVRSLGYYVFWGTEITNVSIPDSVTSFGIGVFRHAEKLESVTLPNNMTSIPDEMFEYNYALKNITLPESITSIGNGAFAAARSLESIEIPNGVTRIGDYNFQLTQIESLFLPETITYLGGSTGAFSGMEKLTELFCPKNLEARCKEQLKKIGKESILNTYEAKGGVFAVTDSLGNISYFDSLTNLKAKTTCSDLTICQATYMAADGSYCSTIEDCSALIIADQKGDILTSGGKRYASLEDLYADNALPSIEEIEQVDGSLAIYKDGKFIGFKGKRIYTVEEAEKVSKPSGNTFRLRYK